MCKAAGAMSSVIRVQLPKDRSNTGRLELRVDGRTAFGPVPVLGLADYSAAVRHGNPKRDPVRSFGNTPTGEYAGYVQAPFPPKAANLRAYGPHATIRMEPRLGPALEAWRNGRRGLLIHGGAPGAAGGLRPTHGCLRVSDENMKGLLAAVAGQALEVQVSEA